MSNPWDTHAVKWKGKIYAISGAQLSTIQTMYYAMCVAEDEGDIGSHYQLVNALNAAGIMGVNKQDARKLGAQLC